MHYGQGTYSFLPIKVYDYLLTVESEVSYSFLTLKILSYWSIGPPSMACQAIYHKDALLGQPISSAVCQLK